MLNRWIVLSVLISSALAGSEIAVIPRNGVFETGVVCDEALDNPFTDAAFTAVFTAPSGRAVPVNGFYFGGKEWRVRFVPRERGLWTFVAELTAPSGARQTAGSFRCEGETGRGFLRLSSRNLYRMEYGDSTPFYPVGIQTCSFLQPDFDGPGDDGKWRTVAVEEWCREFKGAVNLIRTQFGQGTQAGCALALIPVKGPADRYDTELAARIDDAYRLYRQYGYAQILIFMQDMSLWGGSKTAFGSGRDLEGYKSVSAPNMGLQEHYLRYIVARYGCYIDIWELYNEDSFAPDDYLARLAAVVREADPYDHIITTNYARPQAPWCEIVTFHEYMGMPPAEVDAYLTQQFSLYKAYGKVVQNTEFGNQGQLSNYDPVKWRIAVWTAYMNECGLLFWGMSGNKVAAGREKPSGNANAYIGPESRQYFRVLNNFTENMPIDMRPVPVGYHEHNDIRTYGLSNGAVTALYVHHFADHVRPFAMTYDLFVETGPGRFRVQWIDPADGREIKTEELQTVQRFLSFRLPAVTVDLAAKIIRIEP